MADQSEVTKIYRIEVPGVESAIGKIQQLNQEIALTKAIKQEAQKVLTANPADTDNIVKQTQIIAQNEVALKRLNAEKQVAQRQADVLIKAAKDLAIADTNTANAAQFAAGSYNQLYASYKALVDQYKSASPNNPLFDKLKNDAIAAKQKVDDFNRSLSPDGTLVGEYKTGILNAFKSLGLVDFLKDQKTQIKAQIEELIKQNEALATKFHSVGKDGKEAMASIETQIKHNLETQQKLQTNLGQINTTLKGTGSIGKEVTTAIGNGFKDIITSGLAVVGVGIGLHEAFDFLKESVKEFAQAELKVEQFKATLENLGREDVFPAITRHVDELHEKFQFLNKSDIFDVFRKLIDFGKLTENQINELLPVIINFASKQRISIQEASDVIVRALQGNQRGLQTYGISLSKTSTEAERLHSIMTVLKEKVEGAGEAFQNTAAGGIATTQEKIVELKEDIGEKLLPATRDLLDFTVKAIGVLKGAWTGFREFFSDLSSLATGSLSGNFAARKAQQEVEFNQEARDQATKQQIKDRTKQYIDAIKDGVITAEVEIKKLQERLAKGQDDAFNTAITKGILQNLQTTFDKRILGTNAGNADEAKKQRLKRIQEIEAEAVQEEIVLEKKRLKGTITEQQYQTELFTIQKKAAEDKLKVLTKGSTEEIKQANQIKLQLLKDEQSFNDKIFAILKDRIEAQKVIANQQAQVSFDRVSNNIFSTPEQKAQAQVTLDKALLVAQQKFNVDMDQLEKDHAKKSEKNAADRAKALQDIEIKINKDLTELFKAHFDQLIASTVAIEEFQKSVIEIKKQEDILSKLKEQTARKDIEIKQIQSQASIDTTAVEIDSIKKQILFYQIAYGTIAAFLPQFQKLATQLKQLTTSAEELKKQKVSDLLSNFVSPASSTTQNSIVEQLSKLFGLNDDTDKTKGAQKKLLGEVIAGTFQTAQLAMNAYFNNETERLRQSRQLADDRIDQEATLAKARATSQAEIAAIDQQAAAKKKAVDRQALEEYKKLKRAEAKISLATELANIAVAAAQNPLNGITLGTAGIAEYAFLAGLAIARYFVNVQSINSASSFAKGGSLSDVLGAGGEFGGRSHGQGGNKFMFQNMPVETEAREAYVINKFATQHQGVFTVTGTPKQIASGINQLGGGRAFAPGALLYRRMDYGGLLGETLRAPVNPGSFLGGTGDGFGELKNMIAQTHDTVIAGLELTNKRIDNLKVHVVTREVQTALNKQATSEAISKL